MPAGRAAVAVRKHTAAWPSPRTCLVSERHKRTRGYCGRSFSFTGPVRCANLLSAAHGRTGATNVGIRIKGDHHRRGSFEWVRSVTVYCLALDDENFTPAAPVASRPVGALLVAAHTGTLESFAELVKQWRASPWCPAVLCSIRPMSTAILDVLRPPEMGIVTLTQAHGDAPWTTSTVRTAVRRRRIPDATDVAAYLAFRSSIKLGPLFCSALEARDPASLREQLRTLGPWLPHDWRALHRCVTLMAWAISHVKTEANAADWAKVDVKSVSRWCHRYWGQSWRDLVRFGAWEPVVELALRRGGYCRDSVAVRGIPGDK